MRTLIATFTNFLLSTLTFAQQNFEGKVTYKFYTNSQIEKDFNAVIEAHFGTKKIKFIFKDNENRNNDSSVIADFEKGILYRLALKDSSYSADSLRELRNLLQVSSLPIQEKRNRLGYICSGVVIKPYSPDSLYDFVIEEKVWYADSLLFPFDTAFACGDALNFCNGKSISLMQEETINIFDSINISFGMQAVAVERMKVKDSIFSIPSNFSLKAKPLEKKGIRLVDIQMSEVKSSDLTPPPPPPPPPPSPPLPKKTDRKKKINKKF